MNQYTAVSGVKKACKEITPKLLFRYNCICQASKSFCFTHDQTILTQLRPLHYANITFWPPVPVPTRSKGWICGRSLAGIAGSNPAAGIDVCLL